MRTSDGHSVVDLSSGKAFNFPQDITIADRVWVGEDVKFLKGAGIPKDSVVGAYAVVTKSFLDMLGNIIIGGFPATVLRRGLAWDRRMPLKYNSENFEE
jgi:acetyltransferase-like isoleucine patch superfamily enzyme